MNDTAKAFIACVLGSFIGGVIALRLELHFWWIGIFVGGTIAYLVYDFKQVISAIKTAWKEVIGYWPSKEGIINGFWTTIWITIASISVLASIAWTIRMSSWFLIKLFPYEEIPQSELGMAFLMIVVVIAYFLGIYMLIFNALEDVFKTTKKAKSKKVALFVNPIAISTYWSFMLILKSVRVVRDYSLPALFFTAKFVKIVFFIIHSDIRLLCLLDAAFGVAIAFYCKNPVIGALSGGILVVLNIEVLSKRVLQLVPKKE